jgi:hypothetical protein
MGIVNSSLRLKGCSTMHGSGRPGKGVESQSAVLWLACSSLVPVKIPLLVFAKYSWQLHTLRSATQKMAGRRNNHLPVTATAPPAASPGDIVVMLLNHLHDIVSRHSSSLFHDNAPAPRPWRPPIFNNNRFPRSRASTVFAHLGAATAVRTARARGPIATTDDNFLFSRNCSTTSCLCERPEQPNQKHEARNTTQHNSRYSARAGSVRPVVRRYDSRNRSCTEIGSFGDGIKGEGIVYCGVCCSLS